MNNYKVLFFDLDNTLITTHTHNSSPEGLWDMEFKWEVLDKLRGWFPEYVFIITNQGGIGTVYSEEDFECKLDYICISIKHYIMHKNLKKVDAMYCPTNDISDKFRKPNTGMLEYLCNTYDLNNNFDKSNMLYIGDASGTVYNKSTIDKDTAKNFGIAYIDINDFIKI